MLGLEIEPYPVPLERLVLGCGEDGGVGQGGGGGAAPPT